MPADPSVLTLTYSVGDATLATTRMSLTPYQNLVGVNLQKANAATATVYGTVACQPTENPHSVVLGHGWIRMGIGGGEGLHWTGNIPLGSFPRVYVEIRNDTGAAQLIQLEAYLTPGARIDG